MYHVYLVGEGVAMSLLLLIVDSPVWDGPVVCVCGVGGGGGAVTTVNTGEGFQEELAFVVFYTRPPCRYGHER